MNALTFQPNIDRPDDLYAAILGLTAGLNDHEALACQARLILLLSNQLGDVDALIELIRIASQSPDHWNDNAQKEPA